MIWDAAYWRQLPACSPFADWAVIQLKHNNIAELMLSYHLGSVLFGKKNVLPTILRFVCKTNSMKTTYMYGFFHRYVVTVKSCENSKGGKKERKKEVGHRQIKEPKTRYVPFNFPPKKIYVFL